MSRFKRTSEKEYRKYLLSSGRHQLTSGLGRMSQAIKDLDPFCHDQYEFEFKSIEDQSRHLYESLHREILQKMEEEL